MREMCSFVFENSIKSVTWSACLALGVERHWKTNVIRAKKRQLTLTLKFEYASTPFFFLNTNVYV